MPPFALVPNSAEVLIALAFGAAASPGYSFTNPVTMGSGTVRLYEMPVAVDGMVQAPFVPHTWRSNVSPVPNGVDRLPTVSPPARVSNKRHGVMFTNDEIESTDVA